MLMVPCICMGFHQVVYPNHTVWGDMQNGKMSRIRDEDFEREHVGDKITENGLLLKALTLKA